MQEKEIKSCSEYVFERNGYKTYLNEDKFAQLANEVIRILNTKATKSHCTNDKCTQNTDGCTMLYLDEICGDRKV